ncbi:MAG: hypothetical protein AAFQ07_16990, partial [Chloroflexota bacterium]
MLVLVACSSSDAETSLSDNAVVSLDWQLDAGEVLAYRTVYTNIPNEDGRITPDIDSLLEETEIDPFTALAALMAEMTSNLDLPDEQSMISLLELNNRGNVGIEMIIEDTGFEPSNPPENELAASLGEMMMMEGTVQLRGEVTPSGNIASFYNSDSQQNLVAIFFELPTEPVAVGDSWELDFDCLSVDASFVVEGVSRTNQVTLTEITQNEIGQQVAVIDYIMFENLTGYYDLDAVGMGAFLDTESTESEEQSATEADEPELSTFSCTYLARGEFLVDEGRWQRLVGEMSVSLEGIFPSNSTQAIALEYLAVVPDEYR